MTFQNIISFLGFHNIVVSETAANDVWMNQSESARFQTWLQTPLTD